MTSSDLYRTPLVARLALTTALFGVALLLRLVVLPIEAQFPFLTFYPAAILAFMLWGPAAGGWCVLLSLVVGYYVLSAPHWSASPGWEGILSSVLFLVSTTLIGMLAHRRNDALLKLARQYEMLGCDEERYRTILQDQTETICRFRADGTVLFVNDAYCRLFGKSREQLIGQSWHPVVLPDDIPAIEAQLATLSSANPVVTIENRVCARDGSIRWFQFVNRGLFDPSGTMLELQSVGRDITDRKHLETELAKRTRELEDLYENAPCGYHSLGADGRFVRINATELDWLGVTREMVIGKCTPSDFFTDEGRDAFQSGFESLKRQGYIDNLEFDLIGRQGKTRRISLNATTTEDSEGNFVTRSVFHDITESHELRQRLATLTLEQNAMLDNDLVGMVKLISRHSVWTNRAIERILGYGEGELLGTSARIIYPDDESFDKVGRDSYPTLHAGGTYRSEQQLVRKDGRPCWVNMEGVLLSPETGESLWMFSDITALKARQVNDHFLATHDALTGLANRRLLSEHMNRLAALARSQGTYLAACYIDLDGFKPLNDGYGHDTGDIVLKEVASRLRETFGSAGFIARYGGDEFVVLLPGLASPNDFRPILTRVLAKVAEPISIGTSQTARVGASIGVAIYPLHTESPQDLLRIADEAMFIAKGHGGGSFECFPLPEEFAFQLAG